MSGELATKLVALARSRGVSIATCESLTAGLLAATIAEVPGASMVLRGGLITYATELKAELAGVPQELIERHTVVSAAVAKAMASGARSRCGADIGLALTGVAGPEPQDGHPVGTVWLGMSTQARTEACLLGGDSGLEGSRQAIRRQAVDGAIEHAVAALREQNEHTDRWIG